MSADHKHSLDIEQLRAANEAKRRLVVLKGKGQNTLEKWKSAKTERLRSVYADLYRTVLGVPPEKHEELKAALEVAAAGGGQQPTEIVEILSHNGAHHVNLQNEKRDAESLLALLRSDLSFKRWSQTDKPKVKEPWAELHKERFGVPVERHNDYIQLLEQLKSGSLQATIAEVQGMLKS